MNIERVKHSGAIVISDFIGGRLVSRTYYGYSKREAARLFRREVSHAR